MENLAWDIIKDLLATFLCFVIGFFWKSSIYPFLQSFLYTGVSITGRWSVQQVGNTVRGYPLSVIRQTTVEIEQTAYKISGTAESSVISGGKMEKINKYRITGEIKDRLATINFIADDKAKIATSTFLLEVGGGGTQMNGYRLFFSSKKNHINGIETLWLKS
jgi:hypothetical protein